MNENAAHFRNPQTHIPAAPENRARVEAATVFSEALSCAQDTWTLEPHVCRHCFGRLASRPIGAGIREYRCTNCEATTQHTDASVGCCCGLKIRKRNGVGRNGGPMVDAGIRCIPNPEKSAAFPAAYVASEVVKVKRN